MKAKPIPSLNYLNDIFIYERDTGNLIWKHRHGRSPQINGFCEGKVAGCLAINKSGKAYRSVVIDGNKYLAHRIIWKILHGNEPCQIDHIDGDGTNNREENLRESDEIRNQRNKRLMKTNTSGASGVNKRAGRNKWRAAIKVEGKTIDLGSFSSLEEAVAARDEAKVKYGFHPEHGTERPL